MILKLMRKILCMRSSFRYLLFLVFLLPVSLFSQQEDSTSFKPNHFNRIQFDLGLSKSIPLGDGFLKDAYDLNFGTDFSADFYLSRNWFVGSKFRFLRTEVTKPEKIGDIKATSIFTIGFQGGYVYEFNERFQLDLIAGIGYSSYNHDSKFGTNFHDSATTFWVGSKLNYRVNNFFGFYGGIEFRNDAMKTSVPAELEDYFGNARLLSLNVGVRFITH